MAAFFIGETHMAGQGVVLGYLKYVLGFDSLAFDKGLNDADKQLKKAQRSIQKTADKISGIGKALSLGVTLPLGAFGTSAFNAASDAAELQSAFDQTFGKMSATMNKWAEETGNAMGRSTQEMQKAANTFGIFFNTAVDPAKAAAMSQTFSKLAQDLGSFYNVDTATAIEKLRSGLSGESEPMRDFGVFLTEASVQAKALEMGLTGVGNELTEQEKIVARYALIMEQTKNAQGDVARTSEGTANQLRVAQAAFEELQVTIGTKLLPVITPLISKLGAMLEWFTQLPEPVQNFALVAAAVSAALGPVLLGVGGLVSGFGALLPLIAPIVAGFGSVVAVVTTGIIPALGSLIVALAPILAPIAAVTAAVVGVYLAWKHWDKIEPILRNLYNGVKTWVMDKLGAVFNWLKSKLEAVGVWFFELYDKVVGHSYIPDMVDKIGLHMGRLQGNMVDVAESAADNTAAAFEDGADRTAKAFGNMVNTSLNALSNLAQAVKGGGFLDILSSGFNAFGAISGTGILGSGLKNTFKDFTGISGFRANGGPVTGGKSYVVGERGPELFTASRSGYVHPNGSNDNGGGARIEVVPSPYFDIRVQQGAAQVAAPMAVRAGTYASQDAQQSMARRARRTIR